METGEGRTPHPEEALFITQRGAYVTKHLLVAAQKARLLTFHIFTKHLKSRYPEYLRSTNRAGALNCQFVILERNLFWALDLYLLSTFHAISCRTSLAAI